MSSDRGRTWSSDVTAATVPGDDREWIAASGADGFYLSYHAIAAGDQIVVQPGRVAAGHRVTLAPSLAINPAQTDIYLGTVENNEIGDIATDPRTGKVYQIFTGCPPSPTAAVGCSSFNTVYLAVGTPTVRGGVATVSFTDHIVHASPRASASFNNNFPVVGVDTAGHVYAAWSDGHNVYAALSADQGRRWSKPEKVNRGAARTAIYPWLTAGRPGKADVAFYGTPAAANYQACGQKEHRGGVCQGGVTCGASGNDNRDLYDDFGIAASPRTGMASITYSDDQYADNVGAANAGECARSQNNTSSCDHTDYATQVRGPGIF